jgi:hypothetical protein
MPEYLYMDENGHQVTMVHRMLYQTAVICDQCGEVMWRVPQGGQYVNWGGLPPSRDQKDPVIARHIGQDFGEVRERTDEKYRRREKWQDSA